MKGSSSAKDKNPQLTNRHSVRSHLSLSYDSTIDKLVSRGLETHMNKSSKYGVSPGEMGRELPALKP